MRSYRARSWQLGRGDAIQGAIQKVRVHRLFERMCRAKGQTRPRFSPRFSPRMATRDQSDPDANRIARSRPPNRAAIRIAYWARHARQMIP
eukprot:12225172-Alexandrium_andersonii.AAC.1